MHVARLALKHSALTDQIIGVFYSVYNELGPGFLESVYQRSMAIALSEVGLAAEIEAPVPVWFRGQQVGDFRADLVVARLVLLELKAAKLNFGPQPHFKRFILENNHKKIRENPCNPR